MSWTLSHTVHSIAAWDILQSCMYCVKKKYEKVLKKVVCFNANTPAKTSSLSPLPLPVVPRAIPYWSRIPQPLRGQACNYCNMKGWQYTALHPARGVVPQFLMITTPGDNQTNLLLFLTGPWKQAFAFSLRASMWTVTNCDKYMYMFLWRISKLWPLL